VVFIVDSWGGRSLLEQLDFVTDDPFLRHLSELRAMPFDLTLCPFFWALAAALPIAGFFRFRRVAGELKDRSSLGEFIFEVILASVFLYLALRHQRLVFEFSLPAAYVLASWSRAFPVSELASSAAEPGISAAAPGISAHAPGMSATEPGVSASGPVFSATEPGVSATKSGGHADKSVVRKSSCVPPGRIGDVTQTIVALACLGIVAGSSVIHFSHASFGAGIDDRYYAGGAFDFMRANDLPDNVYISDSWRGQFLWEFYPQRRSFFDNRLHAYSYDFFVDVYQAIRFGEKGWARKLHERQVNTVVLRYTTAQERLSEQGQPNLQDLLFWSPEWQLVYWDDSGMTYVRTEWLAIHGHEMVRLGNFNPDLLIRRRVAKPEEALKEIEAWYGRNMCGRVAYARTLTLIEAGRGDEALEALRDGLASFPDDPLLGELALTLSSRLQQAGISTPKEAE